MELKLITATTRVYQDVAYPAFRYFLVSQIDRPDLPGSLIGMQIPLRDLSTKSFSKEGHTRKMSARSDTVPIFNHDKNIRVAAVSNAALADATYRQKPKLLTRRMFKVGPISSTWL